MIEKSQCEFRTYKLARTGKNALDFYIAVECGILGVQGEQQISIISKDKGFGAVSDFFKIQEELEGVAIRIVVFLKQKTPVKEEIIEYEVNEGDTSDYWLPTAANALRPLYQLIALAKMRIDCIWDED